MLLSVRIVARWRKEEVQGESEGLIEEARDEASEERRGQF
jgi:hypothetical protein